MGAGLEIAGPYRLTYRADVRWTATTADPSFTAGSLEPPLWTIRAGMTIGWAIAEPRS